MFNFKRKGYIMVNAEAKDALSAAKKLQKKKNGDLIEFTNAEWAQLKRGENILEMKEK